MSKVSFNGRPFLFEAMEERSSSDEENYNYSNVMFTPDEEVHNFALPTECFFRRLDDNIDDLTNISNHSDSSSSDDSDDDYNHSDFDEKFSISSNKSIPSNAESENTTHSYSNSLLEDEEDNNGDVSDLDADEQYEDARLPNARADNMPTLSDLNNGRCKRWSV